jgi:hypothetical protein
MEFEKKYYVKIEMRKSLSNTLSRNEIGDINSVKECIIDVKEAK